MCGLCGWRLTKTPFGVSPEGKQHGKWNRSGGFGCLKAEGRPLGRPVHRRVHPAGVHPHYPPEARRSRPGHGKSHGTGEIKALSESSTVHRLESRSSPLVRCVFSPTRITVWAKNFCRRKVRTFYIANVTKAIVLVVFHGASGVTPTSDLLIIKPIPSQAVAAQAFQAFL